MTRNKGINKNKLEESDKKHGELITKKATVEVQKKINSKK